MSRLFTFLQSYRSGITFLLFCLACFAFLVQWFAWIFAWGRFSKAVPPAGAGTATSSGTGTGYSSGSTKADLRYIFSEAAVKIINDFRHLLALVIVLIFAFALGYSLIKAASVMTSADTPSVIDNMKEALQAVVATLGGLVGSIIGYYFGESSVAKVSPPSSDAGGAKPSEEVQKPPTEKKSDELGKKAPAPGSATPTGTDALQSELKST